MPDVSGNNRRSNGQFKSGVSGNPNGRPKGIQSIPDILRKIGEEDGTVDGKSKLDVIMYMVFSFALEGKPWAVQFIADRTEGRATEYIVTEEVKPIRVLEFGDDVLDEK
jgi:hypothetical protein